MGNQPHFISRLFQSRILLVVLVFFLVISSLRLSNEVARRTKISTEISRLKSQINELKSEQETLTSLISYLQTDSFIEEEARKKLNLEKPGERRVIVSGQTNAADQSVTDTNNIRLWWNYFFNPQ